MLCDDSMLGMCLGTKFLARYGQHCLYQKANQCRNSDDFEACASGKTNREENIKYIITNCEDRFKS